MTKKNLKFFLFLFFLVVLGGTALFALKIDKEYFKGITPRSIGPAGMSGRIAAVDVPLSDTRIFYVGTATGGLWKSSNGGVTWTPIFDDQSASSIGDVTVDPNNPEVVWVGTGEANCRNSAGVGRGVFKTLNGGESWQFLGLDKTEKISRLLLDPTNTQTAFAAALGTTWGENPERGVFKTEDGGKTWRKVLYVDEKTGAADLAVDPRNPNRLLAAMWEHRRWPWFFNSGGPGSGLYRSIDGGETWKKLTGEDGLPEGPWGRIGVAFSRSNPRIAYALVEAEKSALCRSEDGGRTWEIVNRETDVSPRPFYYADIRVNPTNENTVYRLWSPLDISIDAGKSFKNLMPFFSLHGDFHELWIHPDGRMMIAGGDGGIGISYDGGQKWKFVQNIPVAQYYHISLDMDRPYNVYGGMQDNGSWRGPSRTFKGLGIMNFHWLSVGTGDGFATLSHPDDSSIGYSMWQGGRVMRFDIESGETKDIYPPSPEGVKLRFHWNAGAALDPHNSNVYYLGSQFLHKTEDQGHSWEIISPDLTTNNPEKQKQAESGGLTKDVTGAENHCTIIAIAPSPVKPGLIWVGTDDGKLHLTRDGGANWEDLTAKLAGGKKAQVPEATWIPHIEASSHDEGTAYLVFDDHRRADWTTYVFMTQDFGQTWKSLVTEEIDGFAYVIREDPVQKNLLFLGTEFGLFFSLNRGKNWMKWTSGFPTVPVRDMVIHPRDHDLVIGTHGRAAYILDGIQFLRELSEHVAAKDVHLFPVGDAFQYRTDFWGDGYLAPGDMEFKGENPPFGALITYSLGKIEIPEEQVREAEQENKSGDKPEQTKKEDKIEIEILDGDGQVIRTVKGPGKKGLNRTSWDLRGKAFKSLRKEEEESLWDPRSGPFVVPGTYKVRIKAGEIAAEQEVKVLGDPRQPVAIEARKEKYDFQMKTGELINSVVESYKKLESAADAVDGVLKGMNSLDQDKKEEIKTAAEALKEKLKNLSLKLAPPQDRSGIFESTDIYSLLWQLDGRMSSSFDATTEGQIREFEMLKKKVEEASQKISLLLDEEYQPFVEKVKQAGFSVFPKLD